MSRRSQGRTWFEDGLVLIGHKSLRFMGALTLMVIGYVYEPLNVSGFSEIAYYLRQKPCPALGLVNPGLNQTGRGDIVVAVADLVCRAQGPRQMPAICTKLYQHVFGSDEFSIVVFQTLMS